MRSPTFREKIKFNRCDADLIGFEQREDWKMELPIYRFKCKKHGIQVDYEHGYNRALHCKACDNELTEETAREKQHIEPPETLVIKLF